MRIRAVQNRYLKPVLDLWSERDEETTCTVDGNCMAPLIREGDRVLIRHGRRRLRPGDIIVCRTDEGFRVQRVIRVRGRGGGRSILVKGDQTHACLPPVPVEDVIGTVVEVHGEAGSLRLDRAMPRALNRLMAAWLRLSLRHPRAASGLRRLAGRAVSLRRPGNDEHGVRRALARAYRRAGLIH